MALNPGGVAAVLLLLAILAVPHLLERRRARRRREANRRDAARWLAENPPGPPATAEQEAAFAARLEALRLPSLQLEAAPNTRAAPGGTRIGGPAWLADGESWPCGRDGRPMEFLAQLDFADLPPLPDYPEAGLLQFFIARGDRFGADYDDPARSDVRLVWRAEPPTGGRLHAQGPLDPLADSSPFLDEAVRAGGRPLSATRSSRLPSPDSVAVEQVLAEMGLANAANVDDLLDPVEVEQEPPNQFIGGHPRFVQWDFRKPGFRDDFDRVLLQLDSQSGLIWGDCGWAVFMIRRADLIARDFSRVLFSWDCS